MSFKNKFQFNRIIKCTLKLFLCIWHANPLLHFKAREKNIHDDSNLFRWKKSFEYIARVFSKVSVKWNEAWGYSLFQKKKELWYFTECKKVYCITIIVWCIHIFDVHGWMKLDPRSILNWKSESLVYCCISLVYTNLLANNIYGYRFKSTCRPKRNKINQTFIEHSLNL